MSTSQVIIALLSACLKEEFTDSVKEAWLWLWTFLTRSMVQVCYVISQGRRKQEQHQFCKKYQAYKVFTNLTSLPRLFTHHSHIRTRVHSLLHTLL